MPPHGGIAARVIHNNSIVKYIDKFLAWLQLGIIGGFFLTASFGSTFNVRALIVAFALALLIGWMRANRQSKDIAHAHAHTSHQGVLAAAKIMTDMLTRSMEEIAPSQKKRRVPRKKLSELAKGRTRVGGRFVAEKKHGKS